MVHRYGEGSIYFDKGKQLYVGSVEVGAPGERRHRKVVKSKLKKDVLAKMRAVQSSKDRGLPALNQTTTTGAWLEWWGTEVLPGTVKDATADSYRWLMTKYVVPKLGNVPLAKLSPEHVQTLMRSMASRGLSPRTRAYTRAVLRRALSQAEQWGKVSRNVAALVQAPKKAPSKLSDALTADEAAAVLTEAHGDRLEALAVLVLGVGLRQGETFRLRWAYVDLDHGSLTVVQAKTAAGRRTIALPGFVVSALKAHRSRQLAERLAATFWHDPELVFATAIGTPLDARNTLRWWHDLTIRAGVGRRRFHASRHTSATLMLNNGVPLEVVSATLGHAGLAITADVYAKVKPELQRTAADAMEQVLGG